jgi:hypothetical protein
MGKTGPSACVASAAAGQRLEMLVLKEVKPRWDASVDFSRPGLTASFCLASGRVQIAFLGAIGEDRQV